MKQQSDTVTLGDFQSLQNSSKAKSALTQFGVSDALGAEEDRHVRRVLLAKDGFEEIRLHGFSFWRELGLGKRVCDYM